MAGTEIPGDWYEGFFEHEWLELLALPPEEWTLRQADFLVEILELARGTEVLDVACGRGRIAIELARRGCRVTGLDLSPRSLELARGAADEAGVELDLVEVDMRALDAVERFDAVVNLYSSFGYFAESQDDERVVANVARALRPGGRFVIDTVNPIALARSFDPKDWRIFDDETVLLEDRWYDHLRGRTEAVWTFVRRDGSRSQLSHSLRAYTPRELVEMLGGAGLEVDASWGSWDGGELGEGTRTILRATKA